MYPFTIYTLDTDGMITTPWALPLREGVCLGGILYGPVEAIKSGQTNEFFPLLVVLVTVSCHSNENVTKTHT